MPRRWGPDDEADAFHHVRATSSPTSARSARIQRLQTRPTRRRAARPRASRQVVEDAVDGAGQRVGIASGTTWPPPVARMTSPQPIVGDDDRRTARSASSGTSPRSRAARIDHDVRVRQRLEALAGSQQPGKERAALETSVRTSARTSTPVPMSCRRSRARRRIGVSRERAREDSSRCGVCLPKTHQRSGWEREALTEAARRDRA